MLMMSMLMMSELLASDYVDVFFALEDETNSNSRSIRFAAVFCVKHMYIKAIRIKSAHLIISIHIKIIISFFSFTMEAEL